MLRSIARILDSQKKRMECDIDVWKKRWFQITLSPFILLVVGATLVSVLWWWTSSTASSNMSQQVVSVHANAMTALYQSMVTFFTVISVYSHSMDSIDFLPFQTAEMMFGPVLQESNFTGATCAVISRITSQAQREIVQADLSTYVGRPVVFFEVNGSVAGVQSEYWVITHGDTGLSPETFGFDLSQTAIITEQFQGSIQLGRPYASQASTGPPSERVLLVTDIVYNCPLVSFRDVSSPYNSSQIPPIGSTANCAQRSAPVADRINLATAAVTCTTAVSSFFTSPVFSDESTCFTVVDQVANTLLWESSNPACLNLSSATNISSVFDYPGRSWVVTHFALPQPESSQSIAMLAGYSSLFVAISICGTALLFYREKQRGEDMRLEQTKRESLRVFLDTTSHDMRSPLQACMNLVHLVLSEQKDRLDANGTEDLHTLQHSLLLLEDIVSNVLDFQKIEAGSVQFAADKGLDILRELENLLGIVSHGAAAKSRCRFSFQILFTNNVRVTCDRARLCRAIMNVVGNALKFTKEGFVEVKISFMFVCQTHVKLQAVIHDSGSGIPEDVLPRLYQPYEGVGINNGGGSGLGMFITKAVVDHYQGSIDVVTKVGEGTCFTLVFQLPVTPQDQVGAGVDPITASSSPSVSAKEILPRVDVESSKDNNKSLFGEQSPVKSSERIEIEISPRNHSAVPSLPLTSSSIWTESSNATMTPASLMWRSHEELLASKSQQEEDDMFDVVVIPTSVGSSEFRERAPNHPFLNIGDRGRSMSTINVIPERDSDQGNSARKKSMASAAFSTDNTATAKKGQVVMFAEDNLINMKTGTRILRSFGAEMICAMDGLEAWNLSKENYSRIDLFIFDVNMPEFCGDEVTRRVRQLEVDNGWPRKPIYALTGHAEQAIIGDLLTAGFTDVLTKPATPADLQKLLLRKG